MRGNYAGIGFTHMTNVATLGASLLISYQSTTISISSGVGTATWYAQFKNLPTDEQIEAHAYYTWDESGIKQRIRHFWCLTKVRVLKEESQGGATLLFRVYGVGQRPHGMNTTEKLIFIASFMWMMQWGTRVTSVALHALS